MVIWCSMLRETRANGGVSQVQMIEPYQPCFCSLLSMRNKSAWLFSKHASQWLYLRARGHVQGSHLVNTSQISHLIVMLCTHRCIGLRCPKGGRLFTRILFAKRHMLEQDCILFKRGVHSLAVVALAQFQPVPRWMQLQWSWRHLIAWFWLQTSIIQICDHVVVRVPVSEWFQAPKSVGWYCVVL